MWSLGLNLVGFVNALYTMAAIFTLLDAGAWTSVRLSVAVTVAVFPEDNSEGANF